MRNHWGKDTPGNRPDGKCRDHIGLNNTVRAQQNVGSGLWSGAAAQRCSFFFCAVHLHKWFRTGCVAKCAGWGFTAVTKRPRPGTNRWWRPVTSTNQHGENFYIGATRVTNNTAEMQGVIEALFWLNTCVERGQLRNFSECNGSVKSSLKISLRPFRCSSSPFSSTPFQDRSSGLRWWTFQPLFCFFFFGDNSHRTMRVIHVIVKTEETQRLRIKFVLYRTT